MSTNFDDDDQAPAFVVSETYINADKGHIFGESGWQEAWTDDPGQIYRSAQSEYGRCTGKVFHDFGGKTYAVGWVFQGRDLFDDARSGLRRPRGPSSYLREVWVSCGLRFPDGVYAYDVKRRHEVPRPKAGA